jgi:hypothetical protein
MPEDLQKLKDLQQAYNKTFGSEEGQKVLDDLRKVCFNEFTTVNENPYMTHFNEGQRAVLLHINTRIKMNLLQPREE